MERDELLKEIRYFVKTRLTNTRTGVKRTIKELLYIESLFDKYEDKA